MKNLFFTLLFLTSLTTFAQENFIEVAVRDTIMMKPISFTYQVTVDQTNLAGADTGQGIDLNNFDARNVSAASDLKLKEIEKFLLKKGYAPKLISKDRSHSVTAIFSRNGPGYEVTLKTKAQQDKLEKEIQELTSVKGETGAMQYGDESIYDGALYKKLIDKARKKATTLAGLSGFKLGKIASVAEEAPKEDAATELTTLIAKMREAENGVQGELSRLLTVRFYVTNN